MKTCFNYDKIKRYAFNKRSLGLPAIGSDPFNNIALENIYSDSPPTYFQRKTLAEAGVFYCDLLMSKRLLFKRGYEPNFSPIFGIA